MSNKTCAKCKQSKDISEFSIRVRSRDGLTSRCKECNRDDHLKWSRANPKKKYTSKLLHEHKNPEKTKQNKRKQTYKKYGISIEEYDLMLSNQGNCCHICKRHKSIFSKALHVDHNHSTGKVRGVLCQKCNRGIGYFNDDVDLLRKAIEYLSKST